MTDQFKQNSGFAENRLGDATSPYLLQHKDNPVHWQPWEPAVFAEARRRNVPVLLSIGYAACHWCHVMAHESFEDDDVAALMNAHFVCIKLDREERPDLDDIYMNALALMGEQGGWPLTICLDHDAKPFWGGTYFPKTPQYGRPGFMQILTEINRIWHEAPDKIAANTKALGAALATQAQADARGDMPADLPTEAATMLNQHIDLTLGGLAGAPKFPQPFLYQFIWQQAEALDDSAMRAGVQVTLEKICQGGIFDHLAGGFARYAVDEAWLVPHFEKMLYDNALLIGLMTQVWRATKSPLLATRIRQTVAWVGAEMRLANGGFAASLDADSEGEEGRFYVWQRSEIEALLGPRATAFCAAYGVSAAGNFEGQNILSLLAPENDPADMDGTAFDTERASLLEARRARPAPGRDDKLLADWNGLMIAALTEAAMVFDEPAWAAMAEQAFGAARAALSDDTKDEEGMLRHSARDGRVLPMTLSADLAFFGLAACALYQATGTPTYLAHAEAYAETLLARFHDTQLGGFRARAHGAEDDGLVNMRPYQDNAMPSANAAAYDLFNRLATLTGKADYAAHGGALFTALSGHLSKSYPSMTALLAAHYAAQHTLSIIIVGPDNAARHALLQAAWRHPITTRCIVALQDTNSLDAKHPAFAKSPIDGAPTAYICQGAGCLAPITTADELRTQLDALVQARHSQAEG